MDNVFLAITLLSMPALLLGLIRPRTYGGGRWRAVGIAFAMLIGGFVGVGVTHDRTADNTVVAPIAPVVVAAPIVPVVPVAPAPVTAAPPPRVQVAAPAAPPAPAPAPVAPPLPARAATPVQAQPNDTTSRVRREAEGYLGVCLAQAAAAVQECESFRAGFISDYLRARAGDYRGQRNVAYMLKGQERGVTQNVIQSCAWRLVIMSTGHAQVGQGDEANMRIDCATLNEGGRQAAIARADALLRQIVADPVRSPPARAAAQPPPGPLRGDAQPLTADPLPRR